MGRKLQFDKKKAIRKATLLFWQQGYINTSLKQILKVMDIGESSFYNAFKNKKSLYIECLNYYNNFFMKKRIDLLYIESSCKARIFDFFETVISDLNQFKQKSCLMTNSLTEEILSKQDIKKNIFSNFDYFINYIATLIKQGIKNGEFKKNLNPEITTQITFTYLHGLDRLSVFNFHLKSRKKEVFKFLNSIFH